jgi:hypothetical protein
MPRHTHPRPRRKHSRAHTRYHRDRYIEKRWRLAKRIYSDEVAVRYYWDPRLIGEHVDIPMRNLLDALEASIVIHPEVIRRLPRAALWPAPWPFNLDRNRFARNPFNTCSCLLCKWDKKVEPTRAREKRGWRSHAIESVSKR